MRFRTPTPICLIATLAAAVLLGAPRCVLAEYLAPTASSSGGVGFLTLAGAAQGASELTDSWDSNPAPFPEFPGPAPDEPIDPLGVEQTAVCFGATSRPNQPDGPGGPKNLRDSGGTSPALVGPRTTVPPPYPAGSLAVRSAALRPEPIASRLFRPPKLI
jgi:hypothetical protein